MHMFRQTDGLTHTHERTRDSGVQLPNQKRASDRHRVRVVNPADPALGNRHRHLCSGQMR